MATVTPGKTFTSNEVVTPANLNLLGTPTVVVADNEVTTAKLADGAVTTAKIAAANVTTAKIADANVTTAKLATLTQQALLPAGAIMPFAMSAAPSGWLAANGGEYSKTGTYAALFAAIGATYGETNGAGGTGTSHFRVPDLRGIFVRGSEAQTISGTNYSGTFAEKQQDQLKSHTHTETNYTFGTVGMQGASAANINSATAGFPATGPAVASPPGSTLVGAETRPANIALLYCIKA